MSLKKILVLGAGYSGKKLALLAAASNYEVVATTRSDATIQHLQSQPNITPIRWSVGDDDMAWLSHLSPSTALVYSIPTLFSDYQSNPDDPALDRHVRPVASALQHCIAHEAHRFIYLSSTSVYGDHKGQWVDEDSPLHPISPYGKMRADIESFLTHSDTDFPISIARLGGIYGPGRSLIERIRSGRFTLVDNGKKVTNRIHVHDLVRALLAILERGPHGQSIFNFTDGHPQSIQDVVEFICTETGLPHPPAESLDHYCQRTQNPNTLARRTSQIRVRNARLRRQLNIDLQYPDAFAGYQALIHHDESDPKPSA